MTDDVSRRTEAVPTRERPLALYAKVAIVTGAAKGIGGEISAALADDGAAVVLAGRDLHALERREAVLNERFADAETLAVWCDVTDEAATANLAAAAHERFGSIDILVNTVGLTGPIETPAQDVAADDFRFVLDVTASGRSSRARPWLRRSSSAAAAGS
jgi:3-oxoacyl-[acyl-carrier protein] reductase